MTGFGRGQATIPEGIITVEIKSLNSKQMDLSVRMPSLLREKEHELRAMISKALGRGKADVFVSLEKATAESKENSQTSGVINGDLFANYYEQLSQLADNIGFDMQSEQLVSTILRMPEIIQTRTQTLSAEAFEALMLATATAIDNIDEFRLREGGVLMADLLTRVDTIESLMDQVTPFESERIDTVKSRIMENLEKLSMQPDTNRLEQEMIYYIEKFDITEEKVRLRQHCQYFREVSAETTGAGRKLGFIAQEMGREINTMGSKANHSQIQRIVVNMKDELEKIKEQLLNIL